jgi:hypothetical protein
MDEKFPGTVTIALDANFPFVNGFPLLPHLSHADGKSWTSPIITKMRTAPS